MSDMTWIQPKDQLSHNKLFLSDQDKLSRRLRQSTLAPEQGG